MQALSRPLPEFFAALESRGLSLELNAAGDGLILHGPKDNRTQSIRAYIGQHKAAIIEHLRGPVPVDVTPAEPDEETLEDPFAGEPLPPHSLTFGPVRMAGEDYVEATLTYDGAGGTWRETGVGTDERDALVDMLNCTNQQPDEEVPRKEKRLLIELILDERYPA